MEALALASPPLSNIRRLLPNTDMAAVSPRRTLTHEQRQALIHRPFQITTFPGARWGGCAVTDNFFGTRDWADRGNGSVPQGSGAFPDLRGVGDRGEVHYDHELEAA